MCDAAVMLALWCCSGRLKELKGRQVVERKLHTLA